MIIEHKTLQLKNKIVFEKMTIQNFRRMPKPFSENEACFMYLQEGSFHFRTPERLLEFKKGDAFLAKCSDYFFEQNDEIHKTHTTTTGIGIYLYPSIIKQLFDFDLSVSDFETNYDVTRVNTDTILQNFIVSIDYLLDNPSISNDSMIKVKLKEFLLILSNTENAATLADFIASLFKPYEYDFKMIINQNIYSTLSVAELANLAGMSISTFQRTFQSVFNQTPAKYILEQRMLRAMELLSNHDKRIAEIAYESGFQSVSTFNRLFKKTYNLSPSEYRLNGID